MADKNGGPAFPTVARDGNWQPHHDGMSLRDWFAGMALQGMLSANPGAPKGVDENNVDQVLARESYRAADAMLKEREK